MGLMHDRTWTQRDWYTLEVDRLSVSQSNRVGYQTRCVQVLRVKVRPDEGYTWYRPYTIGLALNRTGRPTHTHEKVGPLCPSNIVSQPIRMRHTGIGTGTH